MRFYNKFDTLSDDYVILKITQHYRGNKTNLPFYYYDIFEKTTGEFAGKISIRIGNNKDSYYNGHIGYEINKLKRGHNYSYYACRLVLPVAKSYGMEKIYLTCASSNEPSRKIIEKLGSELVEICEIPKDCFFYHNGIEDYCIYTLSF